MPGSNTTGDDSPPETPAGDPSECLRDCAQLLQRGPWQRMNENELRWQWTGPRQMTARELLGNAAEIHVFPSVNRRDTISVCLLSDGGVISYARDNGDWIHTLNGLSDLRYKIYELNLMPLPELGEFLRRA